MGIVSAQLRIVTHTNWDDHALIGKPGEKNGITLPLGQFRFGVGS